ncbi:uncharacterized protein LOC111025579 [Momordica charantia]|uniref:Uncharacterized protein LOC111025579 n=1 Tax=Momordica charantia TaxID=3673 RepID=A0A6J1E1J6_MOMCH|nr:uncharacterized protein LOC111025579 [Momordica charantia]
MLLKRVLQHLQGEILIDAQQKELEGLKLKDLKAKNYLFQVIDRSILETILCKESSKDIWESMKKKYQGSSRTKRAQLQVLRNEFEMLQMKEGESVTSYLANKMRFHGEKMEDVVIVEKVLRFMAPKFNYVVCSIVESKDVDTLSLDELQKDEDEVEVGVEVQAEAQAKEEDIKATTMVVPTNLKAESECYTKLSHNRDKEETSHFVEKNEVETLLMATQDSKEPEPDNWYVDTGCSNNMSGSKSSFSHLNEDFHSTVSFGDLSIVKVIGKGDIKIKTKNGFVETISNFLFVPSLNSNLLSVGQLLEKGYVITLKDDSCEIYDPIRGAIAVVPMSANRLFPLKIESTQPCLMAEIKDPLMVVAFSLWPLEFQWFDDLEKEEHGQRSSLDYFTYSSM